MIEWFTIWEWAGMLTLTAAYLVFIWKFEKLEAKI